MGGWGVREGFTSVRKRLIKYWHLSKIYREIQSFFEPNWSPRYEVKVELIWFFFCLKFFPIWLPPPLPQLAWPLCFSTLVHSLNALQQSWIWAFLTQQFSIPPPPPILIQNSPCRLFSRSIPLMPTSSSTRESGVGLHSIRKMSEFLDKSSNTIEIWYHIICIICYKYRFSC